MARTAGGDKEHRSSGLTALRWKHERSQKKEAGTQCSSADVTLDSVRYTSPLEVEKQHTPPRGRFRWSPQGRCLRMSTRFTLTWKSCSTWWKPETPTRQASTQTKCGGRSRAQSVSSPDCEAAARSKRSRCAEPRPGWGGARHGRVGHALPRLPATRSAQPHPASTDSTATLEQESRDLRFSQGHRTQTLLQGPPSSCAKPSTQKRKSRRRGTCHFLLGTSRAPCKPCPPGWRDLTNSQRFKQNPKGQVTATVGPPASQQGT